MHLDQPHAAALQPGVEGLALPAQPAVRDLLRLAEQVPAVDQRDVVVHVHREHVVAIDVVVARGHVDSAAIEVTTAVGLPSADLRGHARHVGRLERRRQDLLDDGFVGEEVHREHLAVDEPRLAQRVLDTGDLVVALDEAHWCLPGSLVPAGR